jgi:hypothetical protein
VKEPSQAPPVLHWLARSAVLLADHPAALRVLCIVAEDMGNDRTCSISQNYVAKRLGISRQATNKHFGVFRRLNILVVGNEKAGFLKRYSRPSEETANAN